MPRIEWIMTPRGPCAYDGENREKGRDHLLFGGGLLQKIRDLRDTGFGAGVILLLA